LDHAESGAINNFAQQNSDREGTVHDTNLHEWERVFDQITGWTRFEKCRVGILPACGSGGFNRKRSKRAQEIEPVREIAISLRFIAVAIAPASAFGGRDQGKCS